MVQLLHIDIIKDDIVTEISETDAGDRADIPATDDRDLHSVYLKEFYPSPSSGSVTFGGIAAVIGPHAVSRPPWTGRTRDA